MNPDWLLTEVNNGVATVTFNRPDARNALTRELREAFHDQLKALRDRADVSILVLRGAGGNFIAGGDVKGFGETLELSPAERQENFRERAGGAGEFVMDLVAFPKPVIAVVEGNVAGAGISIALAADFVLANDKVKFTFAHAHVGLSLDVGLSFFLPRAVGGLSARRLAMLGEQVEADDAKSLGLVTDVVASEELDTAVSTLVKRFRKMPAPALNEIKSQLAVSIDNPIAEQLALEADAVGRCAATDEFKARVTAFANR